LIRLSKNSIPNYRLAVPRHTPVGDQSCMHGTNLQVSDLALLMSIFERRAGFGDTLWARQGTHCLSANVAAVVKPLGFMEGFMEAPLQWRHFAALVVTVFFLSREHLLCAGSALCISSSSVSLQFAVPAHTLFVLTWSETSVLLSGTPALRASHVWCAIPRGLGRTRHSLHRVRLQATDSLSAARPAQ